MSSSRGGMEYLAVNNPSINDTILNGNDTILNGEPKDSDVTEKDTMETMEFQSQYLDYRIAFVLMHGAKTDEEAWRRHVALHTEYINANIRIFHRSMK